MTEIVTAARMREIERAAIGSGRVTGLELMERAGAGAAEAILAEWPDMARGPHRAVVLCGPGNNGGDGFVVARHLQALEWDVDVFLYGDPTRLPPDARANHDRWAALGPVRELGFPEARDDAVALFMERASHVPDCARDSGADAHAPFLVVDALFGIGMTRALSGLDDLEWHWDYLTNFRDLNAARVVALDLPSGLDADTGEIVDIENVAALGVLPADLTVTFHAVKRAHVEGRWHHLCGAVRVVDIGLDG